MIQCMLNAVLGLCMCLSAASADTGTGMRDLLALRNEKPFRATVTECSIGPRSFTLEIKGAERTFRCVQIGEDAGDLLRRALGRLEVNHEYEFPTVLNEVMGVPPAAPSGLLSAAIFPARKVVINFSNIQPFRAVLVDKTIASDSVTLEFECAAFGHVVWVEKEPANRARLEELSKKLQMEHTYEFPDLMREPLPAILDRPAVVKPATPAIAVLEGFIGTWEAPLDDKPASHVEVRYFWKNDGTGLWRESAVQPTPVSDSPFKVHAELYVYDAAKHSYVTLPDTPPEAPGSRGTWDAASRTLARHRIFSLSGDTLDSTFTLTTPDRIDWTFRLTNKDGKVVKQTAGAYTRRPN